MLVGIWKKIVYIYIYELKSLDKHENLSAVIFFFYLDNGCTFSLNFFSLCSFLPCLRYCWCISFHYVCNVLPNYAVLRVGIYSCHVNMNFFHTHEYEASNNNLHNWLLIVEKKIIIFHCLIFIFLYCNVQLYFNFFYNKTLGKKTLSQKTLEFKDKKLWEKKV